MCLHLEILSVAGRSSTLINRTICPSCILPVRNKWKLKNGYKEPSYDRKLLLAACEPIIPRDQRPAWEKCTQPEWLAGKKVRAETVSPREALLARLLKQEMLEGSIITFYHMNTMPYDSFRSIKNMLQHKDLWLKWFNRRIYELAIRDTKFANLRPLLCDQPNTTMVIVKGDADLKALIQLEKKMPGFLLMCAFVEDRIIRKDEVLAYSQLGSLDDVRAQLSASLNHALASLPSHITHPVTLLSLSLDQYVKREQDKRKDGDKEQGKDQD